LNDPSPYTARPWLKHYDYWIRSPLTYPTRPLYEILSTTTAERPDAPATHFLGAVLTFREIKARADGLANALLRLGIARGDRVGIMLPNCPQYLVTAFAVLRLGAIIVNINPIYTAREVESIARDSGVKMLVALDKLAPMLFDIRGRCRLEHVIVTSLAEYSAEAAAPPTVPRALALNELIAADDQSDLPLVETDPDDLAVLQYTGGTTGTPKGAMLSHANIFANVVQTETWHRRPSHRGGERYLVVIPYFHVYAFTVGMMCGVWAGALQIIIPKYEVEQVLTAIRDLNPTFFPAVPTVFVSLLAHPKVKAYGLGLVQTFNSGGAACPVEVMQEFETRIGRPLNQGYGLSETSPVTHSTPQLAKRKYASIGLPVPDTDMKIVDVETGRREMPVGEAGELCIAGPQVMQGYWNSPAETAEALRRHDDGRIWFHTGDVATMDEDGYTYIVQRKKDLIVVDGFNVYPSEVEGVLYTYADVRMAAVIGVPDAYHGEVVKACVVPRETGLSVDGLREHCRKNLAAYKVPVEIELRDSLPQSAVGKVLYRVLRDEVAKAAERKRQDGTEATGPAPFSR
jgi:long-chain acyl-CoA synthetase